MAFDESALVRFAPLHTPDRKLTNWPAFRDHDWEVIELWGGVHPSSWILLPQADSHEPFRLNHNIVSVDRRPLNSKTGVYAS